MIAVRHRDVMSLTKRQREVLAGLLRGKSPQEIALDAGLASCTVYWHIDRLHQAVGVSSLGQLCAWSYRHRLCCEIRLLWEERGAVQERAS
jgi:DNA-binding CsgD family transcriptional regulator